MELNKDIQIGFKHGIGDCVHFIYLLQLYKRRGYKVSLAGESNKTRLWEMAGIDLIANAPNDHPWTYPDSFEDLRWIDSQKNKVAWNLNGPPLPAIGERQALWEELIGIDLDITPQITDKEMSEAEWFVSSFDKPIICIHTQGNTWTERKNLSLETSIKLQVDLVQRGYSVVVLDWDNRTPAIDSKQIKHIKDWCSINPGQLAALYTLSALVIGVDSGPYHMAKMVPSVKALGVWRSLPATRCSLPSTRARNLVNDKQYPHWHNREKLWNLVYYDGDEPTAQDIAQAADDWLSEVRPDYGFQSGKYLYHRIGYDQRTLELLPNHTIGEGSAGCELYWLATSKGLTIYGDQPTCNFVLTDEKWLGAWLDHERMPCELTPLENIKLIFPAEKFQEIAKNDPDDALSWQARYEKIFEVVSNLKPLRIVEIGTRAGYSAWTMLNACPNASLIGFDADFDPYKTNSHAGFKGAWQTAIKINRGYNFHLIIVDSHNLDRLPDCDLCYVDGDHTEAGCYADLILAERSAKTILCDDYSVPIQPEFGVRTAIDKFMLERPHLKGTFIDNGSTGLYLIQR